MPPRGDDEPLRAVIVRTRRLDDGGTRRLRRRFAAARYVGLEIEVNQVFPKDGAGRWRTLRRDLVEALDDALVAIGNGRASK